MKILIDTHIFLWAIYEPEKLTKSYVQALETRSNTIYVSAITLVEIMIKSSIGKLAINTEDTDLIKVIEESGFELLDFNAYDAMTMGRLPLHHKDPFDRMLIAQAITNNYRMMSEDGKFSQYDCKLL